VRYNIHFFGNRNIVDYEYSITKTLFEGYQEENELPKEMIDKFPLFIKLKGIFEYSFFIISPAFITLL